MKIPFKSKLAKIKNLKTRNEKFKTLTPKEKRQEIAFDALTLVITGKLTAARGHYWGGPLTTLRDSLTDAEEFQKQLNNDLPACSVCQRGLLMVSTIRLGNKISPTDISCEDGSNSVLRGKGFSIEDFGRMEDEYEFEHFYHPYERRSDEKLMNICCNVIANGNFKTVDDTDYLKLWSVKISELVQG